MRTLLACVNESEKVVKCDGELAPEKKMGMGKRREMRGEK